MSHCVVVSSEARRDLLKLNAFLAAKSDSAARHALEKIEASLRSLGDYPERGRKADGALRELMIPFGLSGYVALYRVDQTEVIVARVFHMREDRGGLRP